MRIRKILAIIVVALLISLPFLPTAAHADATGDPCLNPALAKSTVVVNVATATTTQLVTLQAGQTIYVCSFVLDFSGTNYTFEYGTGTTCGTGTTAMSGGFTSALEEGGFTLFHTASGNAMCVVTTGTVALAGIVVYLQL